MGGGGGGGVNERQAVLKFQNRFEGELIKHVC